MNFNTLFDDVSQFLAERGITVDRCDGDILSSSAISEFEAELGLRLPTELRQYLTEVGDGFSLQYEWQTEHGTDLFDWSISPIEDILAEREEAKDILEAITDGNGSDYGFEDVSPEQIEAARLRLAWLPVHGVGDGGYVFAMDSSSEPAPIRFFDIHYGAVTPVASSLILAPSLTQWVRSWSRFCFSKPAPGGKPYEFATFAASRSGLFDWAPENFLSALDRNANQEC
jgi:SMI1 / KNR4 family (SUKH-1)